MKLSKFVKHICILGLAVLVSFSSFPVLSSGQNQETKDIGVYFAYPLSSDDNDDHPEKVIIDILNDLKDGDTLYLAMRSLTDRDIRLAIKMAALNNAILRFYLERTYAHSEERGAPSLEEICKSGDVEIRFEDPPSYQMNHKFAVINNQVVITGSYNWSDNADERNWENLVVIRNKEIVESYTKQFLYMWYNYSKGFMKCGG